MREGIEPRLAALGLLLGAFLCFPAKAQDREEFFYYPDPTIKEHYERRKLAPSNGFTFCRVMFTSKRGPGGRRNGGPWWTDFPDSDLNFTQRLGELTTLQVNPPACVRLTDPELFGFPFIYMIEVGTLDLQDNEIEPLRRYLLGGGFLMVDDFWGVPQWENWESEIARVFPPAEYPIRNVPLDHELFHCVFDVKEVPQIPAIGMWEMNGVTYEREDAKEAHCRGIFDKSGRLMVVIMHNTDLGDGWEREGENEEYFREFSAKKAYPMGINIVVYAMTH